MERQNWSIAGSLNALVVLEAAVRHRNFSVASAKLNLSQPAVSRHISALEGRLAQPLFHRDNNKITPTENACKLAEAVTLGFGHVEQVWKDISVSPERDEVVLACTFGLAEQWLLPRFHGLRAAMNGTRVRIVTTDQLGDINLARVDAAVVWDLEQAPDRPALPLFPEEAFPVCTREFAERELKLSKNPTADYLGPETLQKLSPDRFLHFDVGRSGFLSWNTWFARVGLQPPRFEKFPVFDAYPFLLQAVLGGEGVALGWRGLVDELLAQRRVLRVGPKVANRETAYFLQYRPIHDPGSGLARLLEWFRTQTA